MKILLDANLLLRLEDLSHVHHPIARSAIDRLVAEGHELVLVPQVLYESWVVATRPADVNGLELDPADVDQILSEWVEVFTLLRDERRIFPYWRDLVKTLSVKGKKSHDARLVAAMQRHGVTHLLTFNVGDFTRFPGITALSPADVIAGKLPGHAP